MKHKDISYKTKKKKERKKEEGEGGKERKDLLIIRERRSLGQASPKGLF